MTIPLLMMKLSFLAPKTTFQRLFLGASLRRRFGLGPFGLSGGFHGPWMAMGGYPQLSSISNDGIVQSPAIFGDSTIYDIYGNPDIRKIYENPTLGAAPIDYGIAS